MDENIRIIEKLFNARSRIGDLSMDGAEIYFVFDKDYVWSMNKNGDDEYNLYFYPKYKKEDIGGLIHAFDSGEGEEIQLQRFYSKNFSESTRLVFEKLYSFIHSKALGLDEAYSRILGIPDDGK